MTRTPIQDDTAPPRQYPAALVNITNKCTMRCRHCFVYRDANPHARGKEMESREMIGQITALRDTHGIQTMLWMGGEPLLRPDVLREGTALFPKNHITTNGMLDLIDLPNSIYVISLDGPPAINDDIRGRGTFDAVMKTLSRVPADFPPTVMAQCVVTRANEGALDELVALLRGTRLRGMTFSFYCPPKNDTSDLTWGTTERRDAAVRTVMRLKDAHKDFIWNNARALELTLSAHSRTVTDHCPSKNLVLPLYLDTNRFVRTYCCYGNDVDCDLCGGWVVFYLAAKLGY